MFLYFLDVYFTYSLQLFICILYIMTDTLPSNIYDVKFIETSSIPKQTSLTTYSDNEINLINELYYHVYRDYQNILTRTHDQPRESIRYNKDFDYKDYVETHVIYNPNYNDKRYNRSFYHLYLLFITRLMEDRLKLEEYSDVVFKKIGNLQDSIYSLQSIYNSPTQQNTAKERISQLNNQISQLNEKKDNIHIKLNHINTTISLLCHDVTEAEFNFNRLSDNPLFKYNPVENYRECIKRALTFTRLGGKAKNKKAKKSTKNRKTKNKKAKNKKAKRRTKRRTKN